MAQIFETLWSGFVALLRRLNGETLQRGPDADPTGDRVRALDQLASDAGFLRGPDSTGDGGGGLSGL